VPLPGPPVHHDERAGAGPGGRRGHRRPLQRRSLPGAGGEVGGEHGEAAPREVRAVHGAAARDRIGLWKRAERGAAAGQRSRKRLLGRFGFAHLDVYN